MTATAAPEPAADAEIDPKKLKRWKVEDLRAALESLGKATDGTKPVLVERLVAARRAASGYETPVEEEEPAPMELPDDRGALKEMCAQRGVPYSPKDALERVKNRLRKAPPNTVLHERGGGGCDMSDDDMDTGNGHGVAFGDVDGDGDLDVLAKSTAVSMGFDDNLYQPAGFSGTDSVYLAVTAIFLNGGDGTFTLHTWRQEADTTHAMAVVAVAGGAGAAGGKWAMRVRCSGRARDATARSGSQPTGVSFDVNTILRDRLSHCCKLRQTWTTTRSRARTHTPHLFKTGPTYLPCRHLQRPHPIRLQKPD